PLQLAYPFRRQAHPPGYLAQRQRLGSFEPEAQLDHLAPARVEALERLPDRGLGKLDLELVERRRALLRQQRAELGIAVGADARLEADGDALGRAQLLELFM